MHKDNITVFMTIVIAVAGLGMSGNLHAEIKYTKARYAQEQSCHNQYPANSEYEEATHNLLKNGCWSCPRGFKRTLDPLPDQHESCHKPRSYVNARYHGRATGILKITCKGKPWLKDQKCWTCPHGYERSNKKIRGKVQCKPETKYYYHAAIRRGNAGCAAGTWSPLLSPKCYSCPAGYFRNPARITLDRAKDQKACMAFVKSKTERAAFITEHINQTKAVLRQNQDLITLGGKFARNLTRILRQEGKSGNFRSISKADIRNAGGVELATAACVRSFPSISVTGGVDGDYGLGVNGSGGVAFGLAGGCRDIDFGIATLGTINGSLGAAVGADASVDVGFWRSPYNKLGGFAQGILVGGAFEEVGANGAAWWTANWGGKNRFSGISAGYQGGLDAEVKYNWGYTFQKKH